MSTDRVSPESRAKPPAPADRGLGLFVIWERGRHHERRILADLESRFELLEVYEMHWASSAKTSFTRFYSDIAVRGVYHVLSKGAGRFLVVTVTDTSPRFECRQTSRGARIVNAAFFDAKQRYRSWDGAELAVHCSETRQEVDRDLMLLLGVGAGRYLVETPAPWRGDIQHRRCDLVGADGWSSWQELFHALNHTVAYAVLEHPGPWRLDAGPPPELLTDDCRALCRIANARPARRGELRGGAVTIDVGGERVRPVIRFPGDGCYDPLWYRHMLASRVLDERGFYTLPPTPTGPFAAGLSARRERGAPTSPWRRRARVTALRLVDAAIDGYWLARDELLLRFPRVRSLKRVATRMRHHRQARSLKRLVLLMRGIVFAGRRFVCPCCEWHVRAFVGPWSWRSSENGYCPRCNAKARHRRLWLYLRPLLGAAPGPLTLLDVAPWPALARCMQSLGGVRFVGVDLRARGAHVTVVGDTTALPLGAGRFDIVVCQHVLEHVDDDRRALDELFRVTRPGGHVLVSVPLRLDRPTHEDPSIVDPEQRRRLFGERDHVRFYGRDLAARLADAGFDFELDFADFIPVRVRKRHGLRTDEHIFHCRKPAGLAGATAHGEETAALAEAAGAGRAGPGRS